MAKPSSTPGSDLKNAVTALRRALGEGLADASTEIRQDLVNELAQATRDITRDLSDAAHSVSRAAADRATKAERTRADLLAACARLVARVGYEAASVADIAKEAGYTKGALYAHFTSKEDLFLTMVTDLNQSNIEAAGGRLENWTGPSDSPDELAARLISLEAYLYALRYPESRPRLAVTARASLTRLAADVQAAKNTGHDSEGAAATSSNGSNTAGDATNGDSGTNDDGGITRDDLDIAVALASISTLGSIFAAILPDDLDIGGTIDRMGSRLLGSPPATTDGSD
ncbi:MAG: TetR/AcrR family transcriptional regulator [Cellulomonadaceae bacterium]|jgi:AcrR family transcriptional regulator|nr:TetR/AcrR family transcriptional regulator [Cellulomonadaceae bacterium]